MWFQTCPCPLQIIMEDGSAELKEALDQARAAAEVHASLAAQRSSSGTGEMLRSNFVVVADLVEEQDGHLLTGREKARTAEFKVRAGPPAWRSAAVHCPELCRVSRRIICAEQLRILEFCDIALLLLERAALSCTTPTLLLQSLF